MDPRRESSFAKVEAEEEKIYQQFRDNLKQRKAIKLLWDKNPNLRKKFIGMPVNNGIGISNTELLENFALAAPYGSYVLLHSMLTAHSKCLQLIKSSTDRYFKERLKELTNYITSGSNDLIKIFLDGCKNKVNVVDQFLAILENTPLEGNASIQTERAERAEKCKFLGKWIDETYEELRLKTQSVIPQPSKSYQFDFDVGNQTYYSDYSPRLEDSPFSLFVPTSTSPDLTVFSRLNQTVVRNRSQQFDRIFSGEYYATPSIQQQLKRPSPYENSDSLSPNKRPRINNGQYYVNQDVMPQNQNRQNFPGNLAARNNTSAQSASEFSRYIQHCQASQQQFFQPIEKVNASSLRPENMRSIPVRDVNPVVYNSSPVSAVASTQQIPFFQSTTTAQIPPVSAPVNNSPEPIMELDNFDPENLDFDEEIDSTDPDINSWFHEMRP